MLERSELMECVPLGHEAAWMAPDVPEQPAWGICTSKTSVVAGG